MYICLYRDVDFFISDTYISVQIMCVYIYIYILLYVLYICQICVLTCQNPYMYTYICMCIYIYICMYIYIHMYVYMYICVYIIYIFIFTGYFGPSLGSLWPGSAGPGIAHARGAPLLAARGLQRPKLPTKRLAWTSKLAKIMDPVYCPYSLFWDIGPLFWAQMEVQVHASKLRGSKY